MRLTNAGFVGWFGVRIQPNRRNRCFSDATRLFSSRMACEHDFVVSLGTNEVCIASIHLHLQFTFCNVSVCFCSYVTCSFMIETMAIGNAVSLLERPQNPAANHDNSEARPLLGKIAINFLVFICCVFVFYVNHRFSSPWMGCRHWSIKRLKISLHVHFNSLDQSTARPL